LSSGLGGHAERWAGDEPYAAFRLTTVETGGMPVTAVVSFEGEHLTSIVISHRDPSYGTSWDDWSKAKDDGQRAANVAWVERVLGRLEDFGPEARDRSRPWGTVYIHDDPHYGSSEIAIRYRSA